MSKGIATHKQIKKLNDKAKTRKALEDVQRAPKEVVHELPKRKKPVPGLVSPSKIDSAMPGFNHFCNRRKKKKLGKKYKALL